MLPEQIIRFHPHHYTHSYYHGSSPYYHGASSPGGALIGFIAVIAIVGVIALLRYARNLGPGPSRRHCLLALASPRRKPSGRTRL